MNGPSKPGWLMRSQLSAAPSPSGWSAAAHSKGLEAKCDGLLQNAMLQTLELWTLIDEQLRCPSCLDSEDSCLCHLSSRMVVKPFPPVSWSLRSCRTAGSSWAWQPTLSYGLTLQKSSASVSITSVCMWQFIFSQLCLFALFMLALICAIYLGQLAKCTGMCAGFAFEFSTASSESMTNNLKWVICLMKLHIFCSQMVHE